MRVFAPPSMSLRFVPVWRRNLLVWRKLAIPSILGNLADPMIYVLGLGYGLGSMLPQVGGVSYIAFLAAGVVCSSATSLPAAGSGRLGRNRAVHRAVSGLRLHADQHVDMVVRARVV